MPSSLLTILNLEIDGAMAKHDIDEIGARELAGMIIARHGGPDGVKPENLSAMFDDLAEHGFVPIPPRGSRLVQ
ncbi:hypothetical protein ABIF64_000453 [Bradyrhizobium japonicum]|uniref:hypothetical protein n=1 Tax=Bradyrhizobium japonicum TaxID=375 RepID=UPI0033993E46